MLTLWSHSREQQAHERAGRAHVARKQEQVRADHSCPKAARQALQQQLPNLHIRQQYTHASPEAVHNHHLSPGFGGFNSGCCDGCR